MIELESSEVGESMFRVSSLASLKRRANLSSESFFFAS